MKNYSTTKKTLKCSQIQNFPHGLGRGRFFRPDLLDKPISISEAHTSTRPSTPPAFEIESTLSNQSNELNILEVREKKQGDKGMFTRYII